MVRIVGITRRHHESPLLLSQTSQPDRNAMTILKFTDIEIDTSATSVFKIDNMDYQVDETKMKMSGRANQHKTSALATDRFGNRTEVKSRPRWKIFSS